MTDEKNQSAFSSLVDKVFRQYISRVVAWALAPILLVAVTPLTNFLNSVLATGLSDQQVSNAAIAATVGAALVLWQWLKTRGLFELVEEHGPDVLAAVNQGKALSEPFDPAAQDVFERSIAANPPESLPDHPDNPELPNEEITEENYGRISQDPELAGGVEPEEDIGPRKATPRTLTDEGDGKS